MRVMCAFANILAKYINGKTSRLASQTLQNCMSKYTKCLIIVINNFGTKFRIAWHCLLSKLARAKANFSLELGMFCCVSIAIIFHDTSQRDELEKLSKLFLLCTKIFFLGIKSFGGHLIESVSDVKGWRLNNFKPNFSDVVSYWKMI